MRNRTTRNEPIARKNLEVARVGQTDRRGTGKPVNDQEKVTDSVQRLPTPTDFSVILINLPLYCNLRFF